MAIRGIGFDYLGVIAPIANGQDVPLPDPAMLELAKTLRDRGLKIGLLSNLISGTPWDAAMHAAGVDAYFDTILLSGDIGFVKPDPQAFELLAERLEIKTSELVFIDDQAGNLAGAEKLGVTPIVFRNYQQLIAELGQHGVAVS